VVRKQLSPLQEARAVRQMLDDGLTPDGAAGVLGWSRALVAARAKILELPATAQELLGAGHLPVGAVDSLLALRRVSPPLWDAVTAAVGDGHVDGANP
jgi:ParB-like chromosome segregation protein Spo0J